MVTQVVASGRFLALGTATTLPATLANSLTRYTFVTHATYGATLSTVEDLSGAAVFTWTNAQTSDDGSVNGRLWEIGVMGSSEGMSPFSAEFSSEFGVGPRTVLPAATASVFTTTDEDGRPALILRWQDVLIPNTDGSSTDYVTVYAIVALGAADSFARWRLFAHRTGESINTVETVTFPILALVGPVAIRAASTHVVSQKRARVHVPEQLSAVLRASNTPLQIWASAAQEWDHPSGTAAARQTMSFPLATIWAGDPEDLASFGRMFHFGAEDQRGYVKTFAHRGALQGTTTLLSVWSHDYYPTWGAPPFGLADATQFGAEFRAPYAVITGVQIARSWSWWADACEFYREQFVQASGKGGVRRAHRRNRASLTRLDGQWLGCIRYSTFDGSEVGTLYERFMQAGLDLLEIMGASPSDGFWQWQNILNPVVRHGGSTGVLNPDYPISASVDPLVPATVASIQALGGHVAPYTDGLNTEIEAGWITDEDAQSNMRILYRNGLPNEADNFRWDWGDPTAQAYQPERMYRDLVAFAGFDGFYIDAISGGSGRLSDFSTSHLAHGGYHHTKGRRRFLERVRAELPSSGGVVMSEVAEEGLHDLLDVIQDQHSPAMLSMLAEETIYTALGFPLGITDQNAIAREMNPPAWQAVYSQYAACGHIGTTLSVRARADWPANLGVGLTATQWNEYLCFTVAFIAQNGTKPLWQLPDDTYDDRITEAAHGAAGIGLFLKALWALWTEQAPTFLLGEMLRPFEVDYGHAELDLRTNPISTLSVVPAAAGPGIYPQYIAASSLVALAFDVPAVLHSFWRDPETGDMALVLFNWTGAAASWIGQFSPWTHDGGPRGFSAEFSAEFVHGTTFNIDEITSVPVINPLLTSATGAITIHCNSLAASSGENLYVGTVPAYSIRVFRFQPS